EQCPVTFLALVIGDDRRLHSATCHYRVPERVRLQRAQRITLAFAPSEELGIANETVFDGFRVTSEKLTMRQRRQDQSIANNQSGLVESTDQVLAHAGVDPGLTTHRAVDLSQQGRWDLHKIDPAQQCRCRKPGDIADDAATECYQRRPPLDPERQDLL